MTIFTVSEDEIRTALTYIDANDRLTWLRVGTALKTEFGENGFTLFDEWSSTSAKYSKQAVRDTFKSAQIGKSNVGYIINQAKQNGWQREKSSALRPEQIKQRDQKNAEIARQAEIERQQKAHQAAIYAQNLWDKAKHADPNHPYLRTKGIDHQAVLDAIRQDNDALLIPLKNHHEIVGIQKIFADGNKRFNRDIEKKGSALLLGNRDDLKNGFAIAEGFATAATVFTATGKPCIVAFDAGNLPAVAGNLKGFVNKNSIPVVLCADKDANGKGEDYAHQAAAILGTTATVITPDFTDKEVQQWQETHNGKMPTDFNDLQAIGGIERVQNRLSDSPNTINNEKSTMNNEQTPQTADNGGFSYPNIQMTLSSSLSAYFQSPERQAFILEFIKIARETKELRQQYFIPNNDWQSRNGFERIATMSPLELTALIDCKPEFHNALQEYMNIAKEFQAAQIQAQEDYAKAEDARRIHPDFQAMNAYQKNWALIELRGQYIDGGKAFAYAKNGDKTNGERLIDAMCNAVEIVAPAVKYSLEPEQFWQERDDLAFIVQPQIRRLLQQELGMAAQHIEVKTLHQIFGEDRQMYSMVKNGTSGFFTPENGKTVIIADAFIHRPDFAVFTAYHELGHRGIELQGRELWDDWLKQARQNPTVRAIADNAQALYASRGNHLSDMAATEEAMVEIFAAYKTQDWDALAFRHHIEIPQEFKKPQGTAERLWQSAKQRIGKIFGRQPEKVSDNQVFAMLGKLEQSLYQFPEWKNRLQEISNKQSVLFDLFGVQLNLFDEVETQEQGISASENSENSAERQPETDTVIASERSERGNLPATENEPNHSGSLNNKFLGKEFTIDGDTLIQIKSRKIDNQFTDLGYKTELEIHAIHGNYFAREISEKDFKTLAGKKGYGLFYDTSKKEFVAVGGKMDERKLFEMPASQFGKEFETLLTELRQTYNIDGSKVVERLPETDTEIATSALPSRNDSNIPLTKAQKAELKTAKMDLSNAKQELKALRDELENKKYYSFFSVESQEVKIVEKQSEVANLQNSYEKILVEQKTQTGEITDLEKQIYADRANGNLQKRYDFVVEQLENAKADLRAAYDTEKDRIDRMDFYEFEIQGVMQDAKRHFAMRNYTYLRHNGKDLPFNTDREKAIAFLLKEKMPQNLYVKLGFFVSVLITLFPAVLMGIVAYIAREKQELHGSSRFANRGEIVGYGLLPSDKQLKEAQESIKPDILIGAKLGKRFLRFIGSEFALIAAATRQGKGISVVVPNCLEYQHSLVVYDPKMENYLLTSGHREKNLKQKVFLFNPAGIMPAFDQMEDEKTKRQAENFKTEDGYFLKSHRWNPYYYISRNPLFMYTDLLNMANILYPLPISDIGNAGFFARTSQKLFVGLSMYMLETENNRPENDWQGKSSLSLLAKLLTPKETGLSFADWVKYRVLGEETDEESGIETQAVEISDTCANLLSEVVHGEEKTMSNIMASFSAPLAIFNDPIVEAATSDNDFDFRDLRRQKMSIFVAIQPNDLDRFSVLTNLFFSQLINENIKQGLPEHNSELKYQTLLLIDEFTLLGYMSVFQKGVSFIAGYNLRLLLIFQNRSQVESVYKGTGANTFFSNFAVQTMFACKDHKEAMEYADLVGSFTMRTKSIGRSSNKGGGSKSTNISEQKRHLINADEFKTLPFDKCVVTMIGKRPIKADKIMYYKDPALKDKVNLPPSVAPDLIVQTPSKRVVDFSGFSIDDEEKNKKAVENNIEKSSKSIKEWVFNRILGEKGLPETEANIPMSESMTLFKRLIGDKETLNFMAKFMV